MAYYDAFIAAWNAGGIPVNNAGTSIAVGMTTAQKLAALNGWVQTGTIPTVFQITGSQIFACLDWTEFVSLTVPQQTQLLAVCALPGSLTGGATSFVGKMFVAFYAGKLAGPTITALTALAKAISQPWYQANGYRGPFTLGDVAVAGVS